MTFCPGMAVTVSPPMTPLARHSGTILRKAKHGWRVRFDAWGMLRTETMAERHLSPAMGEAPA
jgi:hypothetical protein